MKRKILVLELWGLGDLTFSTVLLRGALQEGDEVHLVGKSHARPLLEPTFPSIRFFSFEAGWTKFRHKYHVWHWNWRAFLRLLKQLRKEHYDVAVSTRDDPRDHLLMALIGARQRFGFAHRGSGLLLTHPVLRTHGATQHQVEDWRDLGSAIGLPGMRETQPRLQPAAYRSIRIDTLFRDLTVPVLVLHAGARISVRRWPTDYFEALILRLRREFSFHLILIPDPDGYGSQLASVADTVLNDLTLIEMVDVLGRADLLLCNDSGPAHLAAACGRPTLVLFGPTCSDWFRPWGAIHHLIYRDFCRYRPCFDYCRFAEPYCLTRLRPELIWPEVRDQIRHLVAQGVLPAAILGGSPAPALPKPLVVVITATYRRAEPLARMLASLEPEATPMAVLVVDNADDPATAAVVEQARARLEITRLVPGKNLSCGGGLAFGERFALERYGERMSHLWMMDDDICLEPGALTRLLTAMRQEGAALACPMITHANGEIGWFPGLLEAPPFDALRKGQVRTPQAYLQQFGPKPVPFSWATGVSLLMTREAFEEAGLHRTDFQIRGEDFEFSLRVSAKRKAIYVPDAQLTHYCFSGPFTPEAIASERQKQIAMLHNVAYIGCRLPHGRRIFRCLPGNLWRHCKNWGLSGLPEGLLAYWKGGVLGHPAGKDTLAPQKLLVFAHTPPPHHGQSFMVQLMLEGFGGDVRWGAPGKSPRKIDCYHVNARVSNDMEDIGAIRWGKIFRLLGYCVEAIGCRLRYGVSTLYYVPAPGKRGALYRDWLVMALCRPFFKQLVLHWHAVGSGEWLDREGSGLERAMTRLLLSKPTLSIAVTSSTMDDALWFRSRNVEIVPNGIPDPCPRFRELVLPRLVARLAARRKLLNGETLSAADRAEAGGDPECFRIIYMARCTEAKGIFDALDGVALLNQRLQGSPIQVRLEVAGEFINEKEQARFEQRCRQPDLRQQGNESGPAASLVSYHGFLSSAEKEAFLRRGDCFVFPSHWESFGLVLLEAMAYGLPIVAARCAGSSEVMPPGYPQMVDLRSPCEIASAIHGLFCVDSFEFLRGYFEGSFSAARYVTKLGAAIQKHC